MPRMAHQIERVEMAKIYRRKKGLKSKTQTYFVVRFKDRGGHTRDKQFTHRYEAEAFVEQLSERLKRGEYALGANMPFKQLAEAFLKAAEAGRGGRKPITRKTASSYINYLNKHILPEIGDEPIGSLKRSDMSRLVQILIANLNRRASARQAMAVVKVCFSHAIDLELLSINPTHGIIVRDDTAEFDAEDGKPVRSRRVKAPSTEEVRRLLATAKDRRDNHPRAQVREAWERYYLMFLFLAQTGCRSSEMRGTMWSDIDWEKKNIEIQRSADADTCAIGALKTRHAYRCIPLPDSLFSELKRSYKGKDGFIFAGEKSGKPPTHSSISYYFWKPLLEYAGVQDYGMHSLRHYYASFLLQEGVSMAHVKEWMGHYSASFSIDQYGHILHESAKAPSGWESLTSPDKGLDNSGQDGLPTK